MPRLMNSASKAARPTGQTRSREPCCRARRRPPKTQAPSPQAGARRRKGRQRLSPCRNEAARSGGVVYMTKPLERDAALEGMTYKIKWPASAHALYVTINDIVRDGRRRPFEIFINTKNLEHYAWTVALTRMISAVFRRGGDVTFVAEELKAVFDPRRRPLDGGALCSEPAGGHRRRHRAAHASHRFLDAGRGSGADRFGRRRSSPVTIVQRAALGRNDPQVAEATAEEPLPRSTDCRSANLPAVRRAGSSPHRRLLDVRELHLFPLRLKLGHQQPYPSLLVRSLQSLM